MAYQRQIGAVGDAWDDATASTTSSTPRQGASSGVSVLASVANAIGTLITPKANVPAGTMTTLPIAPVKPSSSIPIVPIALAAAGVGLFWWLKKGK